LHQCCRCFCNLTGSIASLMRDRDCQTERVVRSFRFGTVVDAADVEHLTTLKRYNAKGFECRCSYHLFTFLFFASLLLFLSPLNAPLPPPRVSSRRESFYRAVLSLDGLVYPFRSEVRPGVGLWEFGIARRTIKTSDQCCSQDHTAVTRPRPRPMPRPANET